MAGKKKKQDADGEAIGTTAPKCATCGAERSEHDPNGLAVRDSDSEECTGYVAEAQAAPAQ